MADASEIRWMEAEYKELVRTRLPRAEKEYNEAIALERNYREILQIHGIKVSNGTPETLFPPTTNGHGEKKPGGIRSRIREVIRKAGALLPKEIIAHVKATGIETQGKTSVIVQIRSEIYRMKQNGFILRGEDGKYRLAEK